MTEPWNDFWKGLWRVLGSRLTADGLPDGAQATLTELPAFSVNPTPPASGESRDLIDAHHELVRRYQLVKRDFKLRTGRDLYETSVWRSQDRQRELYQKGRVFNPLTSTWDDDNPSAIVTKIDGFRLKSRHQVYPSEAIDVCVDIDPGPGKHITWDPSAYALLGELCTEHGLIWGGSWTRFKDYPHIELPAEAA